jgi:hypothetical protein
MNEKAFVSIREASSITGLEAQTLRKLAESTDITMLQNTCRTTYV